MEMSFQSAQMQNMKKWMFDSIVCYIRLFIRITIPPRRHILYFHIPYVNRCQEYARLTQLFFSESSWHEIHYLKVKMVGIFHSVKPELLQYISSKRSSPIWCTQAQGHSSSLLTVSYTSHWFSHQSIENRPSFSEELVINTEVRSCDIVRVDEHRDGLAWILGYQLL